LAQTDEPCLSGDGARCEVARVGLVHECMDGLDNDGDGLADQDDPQCWGPYFAESLDGAGRRFQGACADGIDNDGDGLIDRDDPDCLDGAQDSEEKPPAGVSGPFACADGIDNDGDGLIDTADPGCYGPKGRSEAQVGPQGFERMGIDPAGAFLYVVDAPRSQVLVVDVGRRALIDAPRSQEPSAAAFNEQLGVSVQRAPTAVTGRVRRRVTPSPTDPDKTALIEYDLGAYVMSDNSAMTYVDTMTVSCEVVEPDGVLTQRDFIERNDRWVASRERLCLGDFPELPLVPLIKVDSCERLLVCSGCQQGGGACRVECDNVFVTADALEACQLSHRLEIAEGVLRAVNPVFGMRDRLTGVDGGQVGRAACTQPEEQIARLQQYVAQNPSYRGTQDCGSTLLPQPLGLSVPTSPGVRPFDFLDARRISPIERRTLSLEYAADGELREVAVISSNDERMRDEALTVTYEGVLPQTQRTDGLIAPEGPSTLLTGADLCAAGVEVGDLVILRTGPGTETGGVPEACRAFVGESGFLTFEAIEVRPNAVELGVLDGVGGVATSLPTRECFPRGLSWEVRPRDAWVVAGEVSGVVSDKRALGEVCAPRYGVEGGRLNHRVKSGDIFRGPYLDFYMYPGEVTPVRGLTYTVRIARNFSISSLENRTTLTPRLTRATQILHAEGLGVGQLLLILDPSDGLVYGVNLGGADGAFLLQ
jgi:hypothetical protein